MPMWRQRRSWEQVEHYKGRESSRWWRSTKSEEESKSQVKGRQRSVRGGGRVNDDGNEKGEAEAGPPPSNDDSRPTIQLPGSRAPTFHGRSLLKCCWRFMLRGRCRLSSFARSFVSRRFDHSKPCGTAARNVFPMPLPYPEVLRGGSLEDSLRGSVKRWICGVVVCLNYLFLGRPRAAGFEDWVGRPLTRKQWMVVERFEHLAAAWFHVSPVGPEAMGRTAGKMESMNDMLNSLERQASTIGQVGQNYYPARSQDDAPGVAARACVQLGMSEGFSMSTFKPVDPSRLSFIGTPSFDPGPYLDDLSRRIFDDPIRERLDRKDYHGRPPKLRVHCSRSEKIRLFELLDASSRLALFEAHEVSPSFGSGLFSVVKDMERDRLILDSRGANCLEMPPGRWIRSLANAESLTKLCLAPEQKLLMSGNDLRDFYYVFQVSRNQARRNILVGSVHPSEVAHLHCFKPHHGHTKQLFGSLASLAMGDCQAVELAQSCHLSMGLQHGIIQEESLLTMVKPVPRSETITGIVIDDFITMSKAPLTRPSDGISLSPGGKAASRMQDVYKQVGLIPHEKKAFRDEETATFWGADVDGKAGLIRGSLKRAIPLAGILFKMAELGASTGNLMQVVVGSLISLFLYRRRLLALLDPLFECYRGVSPRSIVALTGEAKSTLLLCGMLLPLAEGICEELASNYVNGCRLTAVALAGGRPSNVAFAGEGRIGEASNPGPRRPPVGRTGYLDDVTLVEPKTLAIQARVWNDFSDWLVLKHFGLLAQVLKEYGCHLFGEGKSLFIFIWFSSLGSLHSAVLCRCETLSTMLLGFGVKMGDMWASHPSGSDTRARRKSNYSLRHPLGLATFCKCGWYLLLWNISTWRAS